MHKITVFERFCLNFCKFCERIVKKIVNQQLYLETCKIRGSPKIVQIPSKMLLKKQVTLEQFTTNFEPKLAVFDFLDKCNVCSERGSAQKQQVD